MTEVLELLSNTALATVQDLGRHGALRWGVGSSGAMDPLALAAGNLMLGNDEGAAAVEFQVFPVRLRFVADCAFALTGADVAAQLDARALLPWWCGVARAGQVLTLGLPRRGAWPACRAYLCLAGGVAVPAVLGSRSTQLRGAFGGFKGRALQRGDRLAAVRANAGADAKHCKGFGLVPPAFAMPLQADGVSAVRVLPAAEYERFTEASRAAFWAQRWQITPQSDRYGYRLAGAALLPLAPIELRSHGIVPGVIQVPPGGQPIVQMRDAQPSGGYPKIGTVIEADLWRLGQAPIGGHIRFVETNWPDAVAVLRANQRWLADVARRIELWRLAPLGSTA